MATLSLNLNNQTLPTTKHPKTLEITFYPKLTFSLYINFTLIKAKQTLNILKALTSNKWGKYNELSISTFKAIIRPYWNMQTLYKALSYQTPT